jgi:AAA domain (dynein-related subfamily)
MTTMTIKTFTAVAPRLPRTTSVLLRGAHGIGKSQVVRQVAAQIAELEGLKDFEVMDRRLSQMSEGDMIGLPSTDGEVTRFNPPEWYKIACDKPVCLFLDELNRATPEVMQAAFQVVLDRELNGWKLHPQTRVFSAINHAATYTVNEMDPALLDRFWTIDLTPTPEDWLTWARKLGQIHATVVEFIATNEKWLDTPKDTDPGKVTPSRRSWERLSNALESAGVIDAPDDVMFYSMCLGYIGTEATIAFHSFAKTMDNQVSGEDVMERYQTIKGKIAKLGQEKQNIVIEKVSDYVTKKLKTLNDAQGANLRDFMQDLPGELRVSAWSKLTAGGVENLDLAKSVHKWCVTSILDVFGVKNEIAAAASTADKVSKKKGK